VPFAVSHRRARGISEAIQRTNGERRAAPCKGSERARDTLTLRPLASLGVLREVPSAGTRTLSGMHASRRTAVLAINIYRRNYFLP